MICSLKVSLSSLSASPPGPLSRGHFARVCMSTSCYTKCSLDQKHHRGLGVSNAHSWAGVRIGILTYSKGIRIHIKVPETSDANTSLGKYLTSTYSLLILRQNKWQMFCAKFCTLLFSPVWSSF